MLKKKPDKKIPALEPFHESILVCNNKKLRPYIEVFFQEPENISQKNLGTIFGVLEVTDLSEDSSYIVNYLVSVIKKEYFSKTKRGAIESFEAALHKANLALSKLAEHGNVSWIGTFHAIIAAVEKNNLHLSQAGNTSAFLLRLKGLTDISEGLASNDPEPHPLKTFTNVSSGRLEEHDKLIITTSGIFDIFSLEEIKKSALRFPGDKFTQFLRTALSNELEKAAVLVVDLKVKPENIPAEAPPPAEEINAFSSATYAKAYSSTKKTETRLKEAIDQTKEEVAQKSGDFVNEKTGHIYIKEADSPAIPQPALHAIILSSAKEKTVTLLNNSKKTVGGLSQALGSKLKTIALPAPKKTDLEEMKNEEALTLPMVKPPKTGWIRPLLRKLFSLSEQASEKIFILLENTKNRPATEEQRSVADVAQAAPIAKKILPDFSLLKRIAAKLDYQQRLYAILIVAAIILVPFFVLKIQGYLQSQKAKPEPVAPAILMPLEQDKNVVRLDSLTSAYSGSNIASVVNLKGRFFAVSAAQIIDLSSQSAAPIPADFGQPKFVAGMDDLNLIFLMNASGRIISFAPVTQKFQENSIAIPAGANIAAMGTYTTYMYLIDAQNSQIYRYPRATGGFGAATNWLKDSVNLAQVSGIGLSDNIFVAKNGALLKLFKGKTQPFALEASATPIVPFKVFTKQEYTYVYVLDKQNSRLVKLDENGAILSQYYNYEIGGAVDFAVDEPSNTAYIATPNAIKSFSIN